MRRPRTSRLVTGLAVLVALVAAVAWGTMAATASNSGSPSTPTVSTVTLDQQAPYTPKAPAGATDDYHCTLLDPHLTTSSYIISSQFFPGSAEVHHAILFLVPPDLAPAAEAADVGGRGWSCFGETPIPDTGLAQISNTPWLSAWAPGHGADDLPKGTGVLLPAGSLVVMQVHYNLLVGDKPVENSLVLHTVPVSTPLLALHLDLMPAPPDIPCAPGVTGPLCSRSAELANLGQRFGQSQVQFVNVLEEICGRNVADPPVGDSTSCTWPVTSKGYIVRAGAHMHLLGVSFTMVLNPGTPGARTILNVPDYNFHYQKAYNLSAPVAVAPGDKVQVNCTYNPALGQQLPLLRRVPPHFVTWGDGSADEMCLGLMWTSASLPNAHYPV
ncbi:MAG TPA: hypothetical protein VMB72_11480 [Acidimicrobiales bacterium]|nr:hypothetical protein [Acidimicrobiales bacterium]